MNTKEYIESGILEAYILGSVSDQEKREVECLSKIYPELKVELDALESAIGKYASTFEKTPPEHLKAKIFAQMSFNEDLDTETKENLEPNINLEPNKKTMPLWPKFAVAASLLLGGLFVYSSYLNRDLKSETALLSEKVEGLKNDISKSNDMIALYKNPENKIIKLNGLEKSPESLVRVFYNANNKEVALSVDKLPKPSANKQYQLWMIVDGKPVDMGVIDNDFDNKIFKIKVAEGKIAAFAITLEKTGGNPSPTMEEMYVMGSV
jgi:anti-sigma-K factor RskA